MIDHLSLLLTPPLPKFLPPTLCKKECIAIVTSRIMFIISVLVLARIPDAVSSRCERSDRRLRPRPETHRSPLENIIWSRMLLLVRPFSAFFT
jgi:hypothetical protein